MENPLNLFLASDKLLTFHGKICKAFSFGTVVEKGMEMSRIRVCEIACNVKLNFQHGVICVIFVPCPDENLRYITSLFVTSKKISR